MVNTLVINPGSSNTRARLYYGSEIVFDFSANNEKAVETILHDIKGHKIDKVAYRVVYAPTYSKHTIIDNSVLASLRKTEDLDPMHMPFTIKLIEKLKNKIKAKHIACFDSVFHKSLDPRTRVYAIPSRLTRKYGIERFGFHGLAHEYMSRQAKGSLITCQLGGGISVSAIKNGKSLDTSMGFTPLEGVVMGTRSGSIDPSLVAYLSKKEKKSADEIVNILNTQSGLLGLAGESDVRRLLARKDKSAKFALDFLVYSIRKQIGAYIAVLGKVDWIVLGGGISGSEELVRKIVNGFNIKYRVVDVDEQEVMLDISKKF